MDNIKRINEWVEGKYTTSEIEAFSEFTSFADRNPIWFSSYTQTEYGQCYDVYGINYTGGCECIELKKRDSKAETFKDCFIELDKWSNLIRYWREKNIAPLYVNFFPDWKNVYVWFLPDVKNVKAYLHIKIKQEDGTFMYQDRLGLNWNDAYHFQWDEKINNYIITKPNGRATTTTKNYN